MTDQQGASQYAVCKALQSLLAEVSEKGTVSETTLLAFRGEVSASHAAFGNNASVLTYLVELEARATELYEIRVALTHTRPGSERDRLVRRAGKIQTWVFSDERTKSNPTYVTLSAICRDL